MIVTFLVLTAMASTIVFNPKRPENSKLVPTLAQSTQSYTAHIEVDEIEMRSCDGLLTYIEQDVAGPFTEVLTTVPPDICEISIYGVTLDLTGPTLVAELSMPDRSLALPAPTLPADDLILELGVDGWDSLLNGVSGTIMVGDPLHAPLVAALADAEIHVAPGQ